MKTRKSFTAPPAHRRLALEWLEPRRLLYGAAESAMLGAAEGEGSPVADFELVDTNPNSLTFGQGISPRDYLEQVSGWYFGSAL